MLDAPEIPTLETNRLTLRPLEAGDIGLISLYSSDLRVARMTTSIPHPNPPGAVEAFVARANGPDRDGLTWAIDATKGFGAQIVGVITLRADGELGFWLGPFFWGLGIMSEAVGAVIGHAEAAGRESVSACAFADNPASRRVLEKAGLTLIGEGQSFSVARNATVPKVILQRRLGDGGA